MKRMHWLLPGLMLVLVLLGWWGGVPAVQAGVITVCPTGCDYDTIQGAVNAAAPRSTIQIAFATYTETIVITKSLTLEGVGQPQPVVSGNDVGRPFTILGSVAVTMTNMTVTRGRAPLEPDGTARGGGIYSQGELFLDTVTISHNQAIGGDGVDPGEPGAAAYGGGLYVECYLEISACYQVQLQNVSIISNTVRGGEGNYGAIGGDAYGGGLAQMCLYESGPLGCGSLWIEESTFLFNNAFGGKGGDELYPSYSVASGGEAFGGGISYGCIGSHCGAFAIVRSEVYQNKSQGGDGGDVGFPPPLPAHGFGGGIYTNQRPLIQASHIHHNQAVTGGYSPHPHGPYSESAGGGIYMWITATNPGEDGIRHSTIDNNRADVGGGLFIAYYGLPIFNSTISQNTARSCGGGMLYTAFDGAVFDFVTIAENRVLNAPYTIGNSSPFCWHGGGSGIYLSDWIGSNAPSLKSSLLANNLGYGDEGQDCTGYILSRGFNYTTSCTLVGDLNGTILNQPISVGPLQDNGGRTPTHALLAGSMAIDAAAPTDCPTTDQRNFARWVDGNGDGLERCDMGAYEHGGAPTEVGMVGTVRGRDTSIPLLPLSLFALTLLFYRLKGRTTKHAPRTRYDPKP